LELCGVGDGSRAPLAKTALPAPHVALHNSFAGTALSATSSLQCFGETTPRTSQVASALAFIFQIDFRIGEYSPVVGRVVFDLDRQRAARVASPTSSHFPSSLSFLARRVSLGALAVPAGPSAKYDSRVQRVQSGRCGYDHAATFFPVGSSPFGGSSVHSDAQLRSSSDRSSSHHAAA